MLDDLINAIETTKARIQQHGTSLRQNETRTRAALIDPLLSALGWDVSDPSSVTPEYRVDVGWVDYALQGPGSSPAAIIEAKRLGSFLENHLDQAVGYCITQGIPYAGVTDGNHWQLYRTFEPVALTDKRVLDVRIDGTQTHECVLQFLLLWRPNLATGRAIPANEPILPELPSETTGAEPTIGSAPPNAPPPDSASNEGWVRLADFHPGRGGKPPSRIHLPDGEERLIRYWVNILMEVAEWLVRTEKLTPDKYPVGLPLSSGRTRYIVNNEPEHSNGSQFALPVELSNGLSLETNFTAEETTKNSHFLLEHLNQGVTSVWLKFE